MEKLLDGFVDYIGSFRSIADKTALLKKEILISYLICIYYGNEVDSERLYNIQNKLKIEGIKNKIFEKYIIETLIGVSDEADTDTIKSFKLALTEFKKMNLKVNFISKVFLLICHSRVKLDEIDYNFNTFVKTNHFIKKSKLLPIIHFMDRFSISIDEFTQSYIELTSQGFVKSSELMYLTLISLRYDVFPNVDNILSDKRTFYPIFVAMDYLNISIDKEKLKRNVSEIKESSKIHFTDDNNYYLIVLLYYIIEEGSIKNECNKDLFDIVLLHSLITLTKEISYLD